MVEAPCRSDLFLVGGYLFEAQARLPAQFLPEPDADHTSEVPVHPLLRHLRQVVGRGDTRREQFPFVPAADAPDVAHGKPPQYLFDILRTVHETAAAELRVLLAKFAGDLGQRFGRGDAEAHGNARILSDRADDTATQPVERVGVHSGKVEERFVDGIDLGDRHE